MIRNIRLSLIDDNSLNPRLKYDEQEIRKLSTSLSSSGLLSPVRLRKKGKRYELVFGHRRVRAARLLGWKTIRAEVCSLSDEEMVIHSVSENIARNDLSDFEKAKSFLNLKTQFNKTHTEIGRLVGYSEAHVTNFLRMLDLFDETKLRDHEIPDSVYELTEHQARVLLRIQNEEDRMRALKMALSEKMSVRDLQRMISRLGGWFSSNTGRAEREEGMNQLRERGMTRNHVAEKDIALIKQYLEAEFNLPHGGDFNKFSKMHGFDLGFSVFAAFPPYSRFDDLGALSRIRAWFFHEGKQRSSRVVDLRVQAYGYVAVATLLVEQKDLKSGLDLPPLRGSVVFVFADRNWRIVHEHWSEVALGDIARMPETLPGQ
jgi:ParB family transcriptional regulator, chromosome partitioning protein